MIGSLTTYSNYTERGLGTYEDNCNSIEDSDDDNVSLSHQANDEQGLEDGGFGDEEQVHIASESRNWKIDHAKGEYRLAGI